MKNERAKKIILPNGIRVILAPQKSSLAATVLVLVEAGSEYETKRVNGISHFLEHLAFKGTVKRPRSGMMSAELDALGAEYSAFTGQEYTGYWAKARYDKLPQILDLVSDIYLNPIFNKEEMDKERGVVIEEINMFEDTPMRHVHDFFMRLLYGDQPAGWDIGGRKEIIRRLTRDDVIAYRTKHYVAPATVVIAAGNFNEKKSIGLVKNLFGNLKRHAQVRKPGVAERQKKPGVFVKFKDSDQTHLVLGARAFSIFDKRHYALQVLSDALGGGMSSRLFQKLRDEMGAAYHVRAGSEFFLDHGYFSVYAGVDHRKAEPVVKAILEELERAAREPVGKEELQRTKDHLIGNLILGLETSDELAGFYGGQEIITRKILSPEQVIRKIRETDARQVQAVARTIFENAKLNLAVIGPYKNAAMFRKITRFN